MAALRIHSWMPPRTLTARAGQRLEVAGLQQAAALGGDEAHDVGQREAIQRIAPQREAAAEGGRLEGDAPHLPDAQPEPHQSAQLRLVDPTDHRRHQRRAQVVPGELLDRQALLGQEVAAAQGQVALGVEPVHLE